MDWWEALWSPLWFAWDLCGTVGILLLVRRWIKGSVVDTRDQVIAELKNKETASAIRSSMDIVAGADIEAMKKDVCAIREEVRQKDIAYTVKLDGFADTILKDIKREISGVGSGLDEKVKAAVTGAAGAQTSKMMREAQRQQEEMMAAYQQSQAFQRDVQYTTQMLQKMGVSPGMAQFGAQYGPLGVEWALRATLGPKSAEEMMAKIKMAQMAGQGPLSPQYPQGGYR